MNRKIERLYAIKFLTEERLQAIDRLEAMQELGIKSWDQRYENEYYLIRDLARLILYWQDSPAHYID